MVLEVTAGQVAVPPLFKASDDVPVEVTASEKLIVTGTVSPIFLVPEPVVETEDTVGAVVSAIETVMPDEEKVSGAGDVSDASDTTILNSLVLPPFPIASKLKNPMACVSVKPLVLEPVKLPLSAE